MSHLVYVSPGLVRRWDSFGFDKGANKGASARGETAEIWQAAHVLGRRMRGGTAYRNRGKPPVESD